MSRDRKFFKAVSHGSHTVADMRLTFTEEFPRNNLSTDDYRIMDREAKRLCDALLDVLPGGVVERLLGEMLKKQASNLQITFKSLRGE